MTSKNQNVARRVDISATLILPLLTFTSFINCHAVSRAGITFRRLLPSCRARVTQFEMFGSTRGRNMCSQAESSCSSWQRFFWWNPQAQHRFALFRALRRGFSPSPCGGECGSLFLTELHPFIASFRSFPFQWTCMYHVRLLVSCSRYRFSRCNCIDAKCSLVTVEIYLYPFQCGIHQQRS